MRGGTCVGPLKRADLNHEVMGKQRAGRAPAGERGRRADACWAGFGKVTGRRKRVLVRKRLVIGPLNLKLRILGFLKLLGVDEYGFNQNSVNQSLIGMVIAAAWRLGGKG